MNRFDKLNHPDQKVNLIQDRLQATLEPLTSNPLNSCLFVDVQLQLGENRVAHKLGRKPIGYFFVQRDGEFTYHDDGKLTWDAKFMSITLLSRLTVNETINATMCVF